MHQGQQGSQCEKCHNEESWKGKVRFDHDLTKFPLIGLHAVTPCEECHAQATYKDTPTACVKCHETKDVHKRTLGTACETCHNPNDWRLWRFDHNRQTKFTLDGAHADLSCAACHTQPLQTAEKLPSDCVSCHRDDDVHNGSFGPLCGRCHNTKSFREIDVIR